MFKLGPRSTSKGKILVATPETNPISQLYDSFTPHFSYGPKGVWKVFQAKAVTDRKDACILFFDKSQSVKEKTRKSVKGRGPSLVDLIRKDLNMMVSFNHQRILSTLSVVCENEASLAVAVEPVIGSLATCTRSNFKKVISHGMEIKCGLLQLAEGLAYLHGSFKVHSDLNPQNILVTPLFSWKIAGFCFAKSSIDRSEHYAATVWKKEISPDFQPRLDYLAPENFVRKFVGKESDIFSLGALICWLYSNGTPVIDAKDNVDIYHNHVQEVKTLVDALRSKLGPTLTDAATKMLRPVPEERPTAQLFTMIKHFDDAGASCLWKLIDLQLKETHEQVEFLKTTFSQCVGLIPEELWTKRLLPHVSQLTVTRELEDNSVWPLLKMVEFARHKSTLTTLLPILSNLITSASTDRPQLLSALLENADILFCRMEDTVIQQYLLDLCLDALETDNQDLQISALTGLAKIKSYLTVAYLRKKILPAIKRSFSRPACTSKIIVTALACIESFVSVVDSASVPVIMSLTSTVTISDEPTVAIALTTLYQKILSESVRLIICEELIASKMLPTLAPALTTKGLTDSEFDTVHETCSEILSYLFSRRYKRSNSATGGRNEMLSVAASSGRPQRHSLGTIGNSQLPELLVTAHGHDHHDRSLAQLITTTSFPTSYMNKLSPHEETPHRRGSSPVPDSLTVDEAPAFDRQRRRKSANDIFRINIDDKDRSKSISVTSILKYPSGSQPGSSSSTPGRRMSLAGNKSTLANFGHNLACTLWGNTNP